MVLVVVDDACGRMNETDDIYDVLTVAFKSDNDSEGC